MYASSTDRHERRIYVDLEYCYPGMTKERGRPGEDDLRQVVQIAAVQYDALEGREIGSFDVLVHPTYEKNLPAFFTELTGITQEMVNEKGLTFPDALARFVDFCGMDPIWTFNADWNVLRQNCKYVGLDFPFEHQPFTRVKPLLPSWGIDPDAFSSGTLYKAAHLSMDGHVHNALHDVRSMSAAVHAFENASHIKH